MGFTRRHVKPGRVCELAACFQRVCDLWHGKVPGILAAAVSREPGSEDVVHDIRIFANHAAYQAHTDKSDPALSAAMGAWFGHYDTGEPFTGELYLPAAAAEDEGVRTSSIKTAAPVKIGMREFRLGDPGMLGPMPDMAKGDRVVAER